MRSRAPFLALAALALALPAPGPAQAQAAAPAQPASTTIGLELNRLEARTEGCRVWTVLRNATASAIDPLRVDLLIFGKDGVIGRRLALELGPLPAEKTMARIFDLPGQGCDTIGALLLNDVLACGEGAEARAQCLPRLRLSSRVDGVSFEK